MPIYFKLIEIVINNVYLDRYNSLFFKGKPKRIILKNSKRIIQGSSIESELPEKFEEKYGDNYLRDSLEELNEIARLQNGTLVVPYDAFQDKCVEALQGDLGKKLNLLTFSTVRDFYNYTYKCFYNLLQQQIWNLSLGLETRIKQIKKILPAYCQSFNYGKQKCWKLKKGCPQNASPANLNRLENTLQQLEAPKLHFPQKEDAKQGPSIRKEDMERYILDLLEQVGGAVFENDLFSFISKKYVEPMRQLGFSAPFNNYDEKSVDGDLSCHLYKDEKFLLSPDHHLMAKDIYEKLDDQMKRVFREIYLNKEGVIKVAKLMKCSPAKITNITQQIQNIFEMYFSSGGYPQGSEEEVLAVYYLVRGLILKEKKPHGKIEK